MTHDAYISQILWRTHTLAHTKYVYKCRVVAEKKRQAGRQADKPVDGVSSQATHNEELKKNRSQKQN